MKAGMNKFIIFWLPVIIYCVIIFTVSSMPQPLPVEIEIPYLDKFLHAVEYGILSFLLIRALRGTQIKLAKSSLIITAVVIATLYAATDEFHQMFVPGRYPDIFDLLSDFVGALIVGFMRR